MPLAGHGLRARWVTRRSPNVPGVGDLLEIIYDPPLPSGRTRGEVLRVVVAGPPLIAMPPDRIAGIDHFAEGVVFAWDQVTTRDNPDRSTCDAVIHHGPGHQSRTRCELTGPHTVHQSTSLSFLLEWKGQEGWTGFFDENPEID